MTDLNGLIAICFLVVAAFFLNLFIAKFAVDLAIQIATGVVNGTPVSPGVRYAMLFEMWLPHQMAQVAALIFFTIAFLEIADRVADPGIKLVAYLAAFIAGVTCLMALVTTTFGLFKYRKKLLRIGGK
jgi:hypothetical protein